MLRGEVNLLFHVQKTDREIKQKSITYSVIFEVFGPGSSGKGER
jgi:RecA/RadA recombinase